MEVTWIFGSSREMRALAQPFFPHFSPFFTPRTTFQKNLKHLKKTHIYNKIYHKTHHFMIYLTIQLNLLTKIHFLKIHSVKNFYIFIPPKTSIPARTTFQHIHLNHFSKIQFLKSIDYRKKNYVFISKKFFKISKTIL